MKTLLLWDIDGTLITAHGAGLEALRRALFKGFGIRDDLSSLELAGRTDRWIFKRMLASFGLAENAANLGLLEESYLSCLPETLAERRVQVLPGVAEILEQTSRHPEFSQGLLTGNLRDGAERKLRCGALWHFFPFGAFADDSENRNDLGPVAVARASALHGNHFSPTKTWVIGDTPLDVACGRAAGLRTIAVATGKHSEAELRASSPDLCLRDLANPSAFWDALGSMD